MSDRKYRQRGYMDNNREPQKESQQPKQSPPRDRDGPRSPRMMAFGEVLKCAACGTKVAQSIDAASSCSKCRADLHTCKQCRFFDPGARFECSKTVLARIVDKNAKNACELFTPRTVVERETSSGAPTDAKQAFANLFKK